MVRRKLTNEDILSLPSLYNSGLSSWAIGEQFDTDHSNILRHLKKLGVKRRDRSSAAKEGVKAGRIKIMKHKIPENLKLNEELSYILGVIAGDGYIDYNNKRQTYYIGLSAVDKDFVEEFRKILADFFKITPTNEFREKRSEKWNSQYITRLCSKEACDFINSIGDFRKDNWRIPKIIKESKKSIKCAFIRGFFDSEGEIDEKIGRIGATSMNLKGLLEIKELLGSINIRSTIIKRKDPRPNTSQKYVLRIHDKNSIRLFYELIGFTIQRKQNILKEYCLNKFGAVLFPRDRDRLVP